MTVLKFLLLFIIFAGCNQYNYSPSIKIVASFPHGNITLSSNNLARIGDPTYVPAFVDKIEIKLNDDTLPPSLKQNGILSNEFNLGDLPYGDYNLEVSAWTCLKGYPSDPDTFCLEENWRQTHEGTLTFSVGSGIGDQSVTADLTTIPQELDSNTFSVTDVASAQRGHCLALDSKGNTFAAWVDKDSDLIIQLTKYNEHFVQDWPDTIFTPVKNDKATDLKPGTDCKLFNGFLYFPFVFEEKYQEIDSSYTGVVAQKTDGSVTDSWIELTSAICTNCLDSPSIDVANGYAVVAWEEDAQTTQSTFFSFFSLNQDGYPGIAFLEPRKFCDNNARLDKNYSLTYGCFKPAVKIIDETHFDIFSLGIGGITGAFGKAVVWQQFQTTDLAMPIFLPHTDLNQSTLLAPTNYAVAQNSANEIFLAREYETTTPLGTTLEGFCLTSDLLLCGSSSPNADNNSSTAPSMATLPNGDFILVWVDGNAPCSIKYSKVSMAILASTNSIFQDQQLVQTLSSGCNLAKPKVAVNEDGLVVISWYSNPDGKIYFKRYLF